MNSRIVAGYFSGSKGKMEGRLERVNNGGYRGIIETCWFAVIVTGSR